MSNKAIRAACEAHLKALEPAFPTAWNNVNFQPPVGPYQIPDFLFAEPDDRGFRDNPYMQRGIFSIRLFYPTNQGAGPAETKAEQLRDHFYRGLSLMTSEGFSVIFDRTPENSGGEIVEEGRFFIIVRCRFYAYIGNE